jgi:hypothetical protein
MCGTVHIYLIHHVHAVPVGPEVEVLPVTVSAVLVLLPVRYFPDEVL